MIMAPFAEFTKPETEWNRYEFHAPHPGSPKSGPHPLARLPEKAESARFAANAACYGVASIDVNLAARAQFSLLTGAGNIPEKAAEFSA